MCLPFDSRKPTTPEGKKAVLNMQIVAFIELALLFIRIIVDFHFGYLYELLILFVLWQAWNQMSYCLCQLYILFCLYSSLLLIVLFATRFQNNQPVFGDTPISHVMALLYFITLLFYMVSQYIVFLAYKEFKHCDQEQQYQVESIDHERQPLQQQQQQQQQYSSSNAFTGRGVTIG